MLLSKLGRLLPPPADEAPLPNTRLPPRGPAGDDGRGRPDGARKGPADPPAYTGPDGYPCCCPTGMLPATQGDSDAELDAMLVTLRMRPGPISPPMAPARCGKRIGVGAAILVSKCGCQMITSRAALMTSGVMIGQIDGHTSESSRHGHILQGSRSIALTLRTAKALRAGALQRRPPLQPFGRLRGAAHCCERRVTCARRLPQSAAGALQ